MRVMRPDRLRLRTLAAWLGVVALAINALVPVHLAFDLAHDLEAATQREDSGAADHDFSWRLLSLITGHNDADHTSDGHDKHHHTDCAVCSSLSTLAGFAPVSAILLSAPVRIDAPVLLTAIASDPPAAPAAAYRSRAPPIATADLTT
jgi:hypothetical protein